MAPALTDRSAEPQGASPAPNLSPVAVIEDSRSARAWTHPIRVRAMYFLEQRPMSTKELAEEIGGDVSLENLAYHVRKLRDLGFITADRTERSGGRTTTFYRAVGRPHIGAEAWSRLVGSARDTIVHNHLRQAVAIAAAAAEHGGFDDPECWIARRGLPVDDEGFREASGEIATLIATLEAISARSLERINAGESAARPSTLVAMLFDSPPGGAVATHLAGPDARS